MSHNINCCRLCLQKIEGPAEALSKDSKAFKLVTSLFPGLDTSLVINSTLCIECFKYAQLSSLMIETVTKNEQKILLDPQNTQLFEKITCRLCLNDEKLEVAFCLFKNTNEAARRVIGIAIINLDFNIFRKPVMCNSCWQIVKSIYLFKKKCFTTERILKCYCAANGINSLDRKEMEIVSLSYQEKIFSENFDINARSTANSNLTQNNVDPQNMCLNNLTEDKDNVFEEGPYTANILNVKSESLKEEDEIEIKEGKLCEFIESNENEGMAADTMNLEGIGGIKQTEIMSNASEIVINKTKNMENICHSIQNPPSQPVIDTEEMIHDSNDDILNMKNILKCSESYYITTCGNSLKNHMETHESKPKHSNFQCQNCSYRAKRKTHLVQHMLIHKKKFNFKCQKCSYQTKRKSDLIQHMFIHQENYNFQCHKCSYQAKRKSDLAKHMVIHQDNYNFQCHNCSYQCKRKAGLIQHMLIHQDKCNFQCKKCSYQTKRKSDLIQHMFIHQENYNFQCHKCSYQAKRKSDLAKHMVIHQDNYNFQCHNCSYQCKRKAGLIQHMLIHQDKCNFQCKKCSYRTKRNCTLTRHMLIHEDNCNFKCHKCSYQAKQKFSLTRHMLIHEDNYNFKCQICSYQGKKKNYLVKHMLIHQDKYNFKCHKCSYQAKRKNDLTRHMLIHQDNCNFQCHNCSYQNKRKDNLVQHMSIHQDNYNFKCHKCSYRAKQKAHLVQHMSIHQDNYNFKCHK